MNPVQRFEAKCQKTSAGCVELRTHLNIKTGRAYFQENKKRHIAARWIWEKTNGPLSEGECVLHRCDNPACVNLAHLFVGSQVENIADRDQKGRNRLRATHCTNGHAFTEENTRFYGAGNRWRMCRECGKENTRRYREAITRLEAEAY